jgi:ectoine hydroxylase-related dioxygenase (phytanoyl-CoA dioxygenase family)
MYFTKEQFQAYQEQGFLLLNQYLSPDEVALMKGELPTLFAEDSPGKVLEKDKNTVRAIHASHTRNDVFERLSRHPRLVEPVMRLLGSEVYVYQFKINAKAAFSGDVWQWHQDYIFWRKEDGLPTARIINVMVLLDEMNEFNGPFFLIPGSHKEGMIDTSEKKLTDVSKSSANSEDMSSWKASFSANLKYSLSAETVADLVSNYGVTSIKAPAGSVLFFDSNVAHASPCNISPFARSIAIITYNSVENIPFPVENPRPEFLVSRDYRPVEPLGEDSLLLKSLV